MHNPFRHNTPSLFRSKSPAGSWHYNPNFHKLSRYFVILLFTLLHVHDFFAQCDTEASGVFTYCNAVGTPGSTGYFVGFRVKDVTGDTLNVVDLDGNNVTNRGKRIDDINTQQEPGTVTIVPLRISGIGADTVEYWYFGPYTNGSTFNIALVDPSNTCDTVFIASGTYQCADNSGNTDPSACDGVVPLYFLDFSQTEFSYGGGGGGNETFDEAFLIMQRSRESSCCDLQPNGQKCFEFIVRLGEENIGLAIDDVGSGSTGGELYADTLNMFNCTGTSSTTWPFTQSGGQSSDLPLCVGGEIKEFIVLSCKSGSNVTGVSMNGISNIFSPPRVATENCNVALEVFNVDSAFWTSPDDPNLDNFVSCAADSLYCTFLYNPLVFGDITSCEGDTFFYILGGNPDNGCITADTLVYDTTYVIVYPDFSVHIDSFCNNSNDSLLLSAVVSSTASGCEYEYLWSTGDTSSMITVLNVPSQYSVIVERSDLDTNTILCSVVSDSIYVSPTVIECENVSDMIFECIDDPPSADTTLVGVGGCGVTPFIYSYDESNYGEGCQTDSLIITRYYIVDFDGDTLGPEEDKDTCFQRFIYIDNLGPEINCPANITIECLESTLPEDLNGFASAADNCDLSPFVSYSDVVTLGLCPQSSIISRIWSAIDDCGNTSQCVQVISILDTIPPIIDCPADTIIDCTSDTSPLTTGIALALDNCDLTVTPVYSDSITPGLCSQEYIITRTWTSSDSCNTSVCVQIITVQDTVAPMLDCPADTIIDCTSDTSPSTTGIALALDNCDLTVTPVYTDSISPGLCSQEYIITRTWTSTDSCNTSVCVQIITVQDTVAPVLDCPAVTIIDCTSDTSPSNTGYATALDNCDPMPQISYIDSTAAGSCPNESMIYRRWMVLDDCLNENSCIQIILVQDTTPPDILCPADTVIDCTSVTLPGTTGQALANDNCDPTPLITFTDTVLDGLCEEAYTIERTWRALDTCGNLSICIQTISVQDTVGPVITCPPDTTITFPASTLPASTESATSFDNCDPSISIVYADSIPPDQCPEDNLIYRTWTATDGCGNSNSCIQTIHILDHGSICGDVGDDLGNALENIEIQLYADVNMNGLMDGGDTLVAITYSAPVTGMYCFTDVIPCSYIIVEIQPLNYGEQSDFDLTPDPDGDDSSDGPDNEIPVIVEQGEDDLGNKFLNIACATVLPNIPPDTICDGDEVIFQISDMDLGLLSYTWNFGSGSSPTSGIGLGPHTVSYDSTSENQINGAIVTMTVAKAGCPDLTGQVSLVEVNPYPDPTIDASTEAICYYTERIFQPLAPYIPGATYTWSFGSGAVPLTATGYGPHAVYYTTNLTKTVKLKIEPNEAGAQCPDSSTISFVVNLCPGNVAGKVVTTAGAPIAGVLCRVFADNDLNGVPDNGTIVKFGTTALNGEFNMVGIVPGNYVLVEVQPSGWTTYSDKDTSPDGDNVVNTDTLDNRIPFTIVPSEVDEHNTFIETATPGSIMGNVFLDADDDELPDSGEELADVEIRLHADVNKDGVADAGSPLSTTLTNAFGTFSFTSVPIGNYVITEITPAGYESVRDYDFSVDQDSVMNTDQVNDTIPVTVKNAEIDAHNYFVEQPECIRLVVSADDDGIGTLRYAISCADAGDTIRFDASLAGDTIFINSNYIEVLTNVVIYNTHLPVIVVQSELDALFQIASDALPEFRNFHIISGHGPYDGTAINNFGVLILNDMIIQRNPVMAPGYIIHNNPDARIEVRGDTYIQSD